MFEEVKGLLIEYQSMKKQGTKGLLIEYLKRLYYFKNQISIYGIDIIPHYLMILQPYILRQGMEIINNSDSFVIVEGCAKSTINGIVPLTQTFKEGMQVQIPSDKTGSIMALVDTKLLKVNKSKPQNMKLCLDLSKAEKQRLNKNRQFHRAIRQSPKLVQCRQFLEKIQIFTKLGGYDLNEIIAESNYRTLGKGGITHSPNNSVDFLGFVLTGKIRVTHEDDPLQIQGQKNVNKYYAHKKKNNNHNYVSYLQTGECIGLEEYLWETKFKSTGEVISHDAKILYIPQSIFSSKFNETMNYGLISQLSGLVSAKKNIKDKSVSSKKQKQLQMMYEINQDLNKEKMMKLYNQANKDPSIKMRFKKDKSPIFPKQCYMPERLIHKVKVYEQKYTSLPKIVDRINLFPEEYQKASIPIQFQEKLRVVDQERNKFNSQRKTLSPKSHSATKNPDQILERILETITSNPEYQKTQFSKTKSKELIESDQSSTKYHFNRSIFNNFRAPKVKGNKMLQSLYRTLEIN